MSSAFWILIFVTNMKVEVFGEYITEDSCKKALVKYQKKSEDAKCIKKEKNDWEYGI